MCVCVCVCACVCVCVRVCVRYWTNVKVYETADKEGAAGLLGAAGYEDVSPLPTFLPPHQCCG